MPRDNSSAGGKPARSPCELRVKEITRLIRDRHRGPLPDDDDGRDSLFLGMSHVVRTRGGQAAACEFTAKFAPWCTDSERDALIAELIAAPAFFDAAELGKRFNLTMDERTRLDIRTFRAADKTEEEARRIMAARHAERQRRHRQKQATARREAKARNVRRVNGVLAREDLSMRARDLFARLTGKWTALPDIARAWTDGEAGALKLASRRTAIGRAMDELRRALLIEERQDKALNGVPVRVVQRIPDDALTMAHARSVATTLRQTNSGKQNTNSEKDESLASSRASYCDSTSVRHTPADCDSTPCVMSYSIREARWPAGSYCPPYRINLAFGADLDFGGHVFQAGAASGPRLDETEASVKPSIPSATHIDLGTAREDDTIGVLPGAPTNDATVVNPSSRW